MKHPIRFAFLALGALALAGCASTVDLKDKKDTPPVVESKPAPQPAPSADQRAVTPVTAPEVDPLNDPKGVLAKRSVYFEFDRYEIKDEYRGLIEAHAKYLRDHKARSVSLEGNADERGSREYNLALGQKRAEAVRKALSLLGVADTQLEAVSFGEEKPRAQGHDEAAWAENRRADIRYK